MLVLKNLFLFYLGKKIKQWCLLADKMAVHKHIVTGQQCDAKWRTLKTRNKENKKKHYSQAKEQLLGPTTI